MTPTRRELILPAAAAGLAAFSLPAAQSGGVTRFVRFESGGKPVYGLVEGDSVREISGDLFGSYQVTGRKASLSQVKLLYPIQPPKVLAVGLNYRSHIGQRTPPSVPEIFYKPITSLQNPGDPIVIPPDAKNVHFEGELVLVIGKKAQRVSEDEARNVIFGVTCGNDVSERDWQNGPNKDLQWWRAKGSDTFGPMGPMIVRGLDYNKVLLQTKVNGQVMQKQYTSDLLFGPTAIVSYISKYVTLNPGDVIFTGTPGATKPLKAGDTVEIDIEGIGVLRNPVKQG